MKDCTSVAFNAKGPMGNPEQLKIFIESIKRTVDELSHLKQIVVYSSSPNTEKVLEIFSKPGSNWGTENPIKDSIECQYLLETGYHDGKQIYNITNLGALVKFQPDNTPDNGYHSYEVFSPPDIPPIVLKQMLLDGKITKSEYKKFLKGK